MVVQSLLNGWHYFSNEHHLLMRGKNGCNFMITACQTPYRLWSFPLSLSHPDEIPPHFWCVNPNWNIIWLSVPFSFLPSWKGMTKALAPLNSHFFESLASMNLEIKHRLSNNVTVNCLYLSVFLSFPSALKRNEGPFLHFSWFFLL